MFSFSIDSHNFHHVHFIGIGGISMSGLAEILLSRGYKVSGSDMKDSPILNRLRNRGATIYIGHNENNIDGASLVVYTSAISDDNPEYKEALNKKIPVVDRATFLGQLMKGYNNSIAVSGTHGKTTTTGMLSVILDSSELNPTILLGGELDQIGGNVKLGDNNYFLTEACEYKGNFLKFYPTIGIILNIEDDHLDYFKDIDHIVETFSRFASIIPDNGYLIINNDDKNISKIVENVECNIIRFGIKNSTDFQASDISFDEEGYPNFVLTVKNDKKYNVNLKVMGIHNVYNSLAAIATAYTCGIPIGTILKSIENYRGTHRRFELKGSFNGIKVIDDYAHHPTEIQATLNTAKRITDNRLWCIFQPHTYTRTRALFNEFINSFDNADKVIITDIYAAREKDTGLVHSRDLVEGLKEKNIDALYMANFNEIVKYIKKNALPGDLVLTVGAGNINEVGELLVEKI